MHRFVSQNDTWAHYFDPEAKRQSMLWKHPVSPLLVKLTEFFFFFFFFPAEKVIVPFFFMNSSYYAEELRRLR